MQRTPTLPRRVSLHPPPSPSPVYPHRRRRRLLPWVHSGINTLLILLIAGGVLVALTDVVWQFANSNRASKVADILTALGTYSAFILLTSILVLVRLVKSVHTMTKIPLAYLPTSEEDVSKVYEQKLVEAKYGKRQSEKEDWEVVVRVVAVFVGFLQQAKSEGTASEPSTSAAD
ncbi:hypothetical protein JCM10213v2_007231 [Rhodosporidiobolus nylandii]